eukprot:11434984-Heterocapsa_arctica.AAC.1
MAAEDDDRGRRVWMKRSLVCSGTRVVVVEGAAVPRDESDRGRIVGRHPGSKQLTTQTTGRQQQRWWCGWC